MSNKQGIKGQPNTRPRSQPPNQQQSSQHIKQVYHIKHTKPQHIQTNNEKPNDINALRMKEKYLKIPVDYNSSSLTDFRGLMAKQRSLLSDDSNDINAMNDTTLFSRFKQLIGPKSQYYNTANQYNTNDAMIDNINKLSVLHEEEKKSDNDSYDIDAQSVTTSKMENNKPSQDYIRRFWMSDKNCTQCSECGATFHTFRRKHHCRLCGRVFCQTCCSERININKFKKLKNQYTYKDNINNLFNEEEKNNSNINNTGGMMRVCVFCSKLKTNDRLLGIAMTYPNNMNKKKIQIIENKYDKHMNQIYDLHIKYVIKQLCKFENLNSEWEKLIYKFSKRANDTVFPDILSSVHDFNDIRHYVKVKRIEGGNINQCQFIDGVILRKNVAHRKMRTDITNPKILLLDQAIEYHRMNSKFHSFDILLKQNEEYMRMIVNKIVDLGPDIVVVSNQCSRLALNEMMLENTTLICNIESSSMERIARAIRAPIIGSIDHINQLESKYALGHCGHFYIKYYNIDSIGNKGRRTPLMFFDKCPANTHSTILLRGDKKINLLKVKNVIRLAMHALYHINLEKSFLNNFNLTFSNPSVNAAIYKQIQIESEQHLFLSTSPFIGHLGWRRENVINKLKRLHANKENDRFPHLQTYPYNHHGIGDNVNELGIWDPFLPNTDNPWICQTLLVNHCRVVNQSQCFPPKLKLIDFYTELDISVGHYLHRLFSCAPCPNNRCKEPLSSHLLTYSHYNKTITIRLIHLEYNNEDPNMKPIHKRDGNDDNKTNQIVMWTKCKKCKMKKSRMRVMNDRTFFLSFGKFLETEFYSAPPHLKQINSSCKHDIFGADGMVKCFGWNDETNNTGDMVIQIDSVVKKPYSVFTSANITTNWSLQFKYYINELNILELVSKYAFAAFLVKIDELIGLIGNLDIITKDLNKLRQEVNEECEKIATQFIDHRDYLHEHFKPKINKYKQQKKNVNITNPGTISFLNKKRYHLYRISSEWNEVLDGLRGLFAPTNESNVDNANRWMKKFKAPFKGLQSKRSGASRKGTVNVAITKSNTEHLYTQPSVTPQSSFNVADENDELLEAALQEVDNQIANVAVARRQTSKDSSPNSNGTSPTDKTQANMLPLKKAKSASITPTNDNGNGNGGNKSFDNLLALKNRRQTNADFEQIINVISPRMRDVSFMVDFNAMFEEHLTQNPLNKVNQHNPYINQSQLSSLKIPNNEQKYNQEDEKQIISPVITSAASGKEGNSKYAHEGSPNKSFGFVENLPNANDKNKLTGNKLDNTSPQSYVATSPNNNTPKLSNIPSIGTSLFPNTDVNNVNIPITMQNPTLNDVDMERLKQESLFLVSACLQNSSDIGSNSYYLHLNLPKCFNNIIIPIHRDEPSAIIAYTLSSLEYHCIMNNIPTEKVRSCRQRGDPSVSELEKMVNERHIMKRHKIKTELEIRAKGNHGKLYTKNNNEQKLNINDDVIKEVDEKQIDDELDLNDLLHHIPKLKHVSKMEYLDEKKEYQAQLKKHGMKSTKSTTNKIHETSTFPYDPSDIHMTHHHTTSGGNNSSRRNDGSQALKFQFIDPGHFIDDNSNNNNNNNNNNKPQVEGNNTTDSHNNIDGLTSFDDNNIDISINNKELKYPKSSYVSTTFSCHVYYPHQFRALRRRLYGYNDDYDFIESLSRCQSWTTSGGKSGSTFKKTLDHRFVLKFVKQNEFRMFLDNAQSYFEHMSSVLFKNYPSVLVHILGVYQISWNKSNSMKSNKFGKYVIVMPNLWYSKNILKQFDLKGALRNRYVNINSENNKNKSNRVMLDKNFIEYMDGFPMCLEDNSKQHLHKAVHNDTLFLCRSDVIDYSLLVGINVENNELVVGIIDYLRTYTWDKAVEEQAKSIGMVIGKQAPTIQRPKIYKQRFREAMEGYFMVSPDRKTKRINRPKDKCLTDSVKDILIHC